MGKLIFLYEENVQSTAMCVRCPTFVMCLYTCCYHRLGLDRPLFTHSLTKFLRFHSLNINSVLRLMIYKTSMENLAEISDPKSSSHFVEKVFFLFFFKL